MKRNETAYWNSLTAEQRCEVTALRYWQGYLNALKYNCSTSTDEQLAQIKAVVDAESAKRGKVRKLGADQEHVLRKMQEKRVWYPGCGWYFTNRSGTIRLLKSLVKRGLVTQESETKFRIKEGN